MLNANDLKELKCRSISENQIQYQLNCFKQGFPFLDIKASASVEKGIKVLTQNEQTEYMTAWDEYLSKDKTVVKFVPASGAASRMFKNLFAFLNGSNEVPTTDFEIEFFSNIHKFAFFEVLDDVCKKKEGKSVDELINEGKYKNVLTYLLGEEGLEYGKKPKGVLLFHKYSEGNRTALEEHLAEGAMYAKNAKGEVNIHFTVSPEHMDLFKKVIEEKKSYFENKFSVTYNISFSVQKPSTDTVAVDLENNPFRTDDGKLLFRPGGHGALIENLNDIDADVVFIKNIDNVVPDKFKCATVINKKILAGILVSLQKKIFSYLELIETGKYTHEQVEDMIAFLQNDLCIKNPEMKLLEDVELVLYIKNKLKRPLRVCGMVKNEGEPGGGPFLAVNQDGTVSLQILESSQIDMSDPFKKDLFEKGSYFNPVDLVCALKDENGEHYNLPNFVDKTTGFISRKSKDGRDLKALELPGLWNGAMSDWNTVFVEVPASTFNPVKTTNDLLRQEHQ